MTFIKKIKIKLLRAKAVKVAIRIQSLEYALDRRRTVSGDYICGSGRSRYIAELDNLKIKLKFLEAKLPPSEDKFEEAAKQCRIYALNNFEEFCLDTDGNPHAGFKKILEEVFND